MSENNEKSNSTVINNIIESSGKRWIEILGTLLLCAAVGMVAYALANYGWLEIAATMLTMFLFQWVRMMIATGLIVLPDRSADGEPEDFHASKGIIKTFAADYAAWQAKSGALRLAGLAVAYTAGFMICRWGIGIALTVFSSPWIAGAAAAVIGAVIIAPDMITGVVKKMKASKRGNGNAGASA